MYIMVAEQLYYFGNSFEKDGFSTKPHYVFILFIYLPFNKIHLTELEWIMVATETICISSFIKMFYRQSIDMFWNSFPLYTVFFL